jgi:hypothetical protein
MKNPNPRLVKKIERTAYALAVKKFGNTPAADELAYAISDIFDNLHVFEMFDLLEKLHESYPNVASDELIEDLDRWMPEFLRGGEPAP